MAAVASLRPRRMLLPYRVPPSIGKRCMELAEVLLPATACTRIHRKIPLRPDARYSKLLLVRVTFA